MKRTVVSQVTIVISLLCGGLGDVLYASQNISLYVNQTTYVYAPSVPISNAIVYSVQWASESVHVTATTGSSSSQIKITEYFTGTVSVACDQYYRYYVGNYQYYGHYTSYVFVTCKPINLILSSTNMTLTAGSSQSLSYSESPSVYPHPTVTWTTNNYSVAQVSSTGVVHAVSPGTAVITAKNSSGPNAVCTVNVVAPAPTSLDISPNSLSLYPGENRTLTHTVLPSNASYTLQWTSNDTSVATVNQGTIHAVAPGNTTIRAQIQGSSFYDLCYVTVLPINPTGISISHNATIPVGHTTTLSHTVTPSNANYSLEWYSTDTSIATVNNGIVYGIHEGEAMIIVNIVGNSLSDTCHINVFRPTLSLQTSHENYWVLPNTAVALTASDPSATIYYTTDATTPSENSQVYTQPIPVTDFLHLKAIACHVNYIPSEVLDKSYRENHFQVSNTFPAAASTLSYIPIPSVNFNKTMGEGTFYDSIKLYANSLEVNVEKIIDGNTLYLVPGNHDVSTTMYSVVIPDNSLVSSDSEPNFDYSFCYGVHLSDTASAEFSIISTTPYDHMGSALGTGNYVVGDTVSLFAEAADGYHFVYWMSQGTIVSTQNPYITLADHNQYYTAYFEPSYYHVQTSAGEGSLITVTDMNGNYLSSGDSVYYNTWLIIHVDTLNCHQITSCEVNGFQVTSGDTLFVSEDMLISTQTTIIIDSTERIEVACDSYTWNDSVYIQSGDYAQTFTNSDGCDSVVTLHLTVYYSNTGDTTVVVCDSYDWYGTTYTASGNYTHTLTNVSGCDSVVTLHLTVNYSNTDDTIAIACDSFDWYGTTYTSSGDYPHTLTNIYGCDSVVTLHLTVNYNNTGDTTTVACDSFDWYGTTYTSSGDYPLTLTNDSGCDSVVTLHLTVNYSNTGDTTAIACDSYDWYGTTYTSSGNYTHTLTNDSGCDSVVTLHLTVNYSNTGDTTAIACDSYDWYGTTYTSSGNYTHTLTNVSGCDSVVTLHLTVNYSVAELVEVTACDSYLWNDSVYTQSGTYTKTFLAANGCDSVVTLHLTVNYSVAELVEVTACDSYLWNDSVYTQSGTYTQTFLAANGCDSVVTLHLTVNYSVAELVEVTACDFYTWNGTTYTQSGDYSQTFTADNGCDSTVTLHLIVNPSITRDTTATACSYFHLNDVMYTESGDYSQFFTASNGCDSVVMLHLTVSHPTTGDTTAVACDAFTWYELLNIIQSGNYTRTFTSAVGCDSVVTLHLTVNSSEESEFAIATEDSCYIWNAETYCSSGDYVQTLQTVNGCDSVVTLHLTVSVGIDNYDDFDFKVYPNPTNGIVFVQCAMNDVQVGTIEVRLYDAYGKMLDVEEIQGVTTLRTTEIDMSRFASGIYFVRAVADGNVVAVRKMVKR